MCIYLHIWVCMCNGCSSHEICVRPATAGVHVCLWGRDDAYLAHMLNRESRQVGKILGQQSWKNDGPPQVYRTEHVYLLDRCAPVSTSNTTLSLRAQSKLVEKLMYFNLIFSLIDVSATRQRHQRSKFKQPAMWRVVYARIYDRTYGRV